MADCLHAPEIDFNQVQALLDEWLEKQIPPDGLTWLNERLEKIAGGDQKTLFLTFGMVPRKVGKTDLNLNTSDLAAASNARPGWNPANWTIEQAARTRLLLALPTQEMDSYVETLDKLFAAGEVGELVALYQSLPVLPCQSAHALRASEGTRTNIKSVFCALAHQNPYPAEHLEEGRWNQMVLKSLFIESALGPIQGLDERANPALSKMLVNYAHERWAAGRLVSPELWRCVGSHADDVAFKDLKHVLVMGDPLERSAAALALSQCPHPGTEEVLNTKPELKTKIQTGELTWANLMSNN